MGLTLTGDEVATLEARTEGWIAALQLAALSLQGRADATRFIEAFAGDDRFIVDYLVEEVLRRQRPETRDFLLRTSILSRFTGPLADAVTGQAGGSATIEALDRGNLFVVALDDQRRWYRYHHLFGGVLQAYLAAEEADQVAVLHRRASAWYEANGERDEAIEHAFRADDPERAADLVELAIPEMRRFRRERTLLRWGKTIPRDIVARRPVLAVGYVGAILSANEVTGVDELLSGAEAQLAAAADDATGAGFIVVDRAELQRLPGAIELFRAALAKMLGDLDGNIAHARRVLDLVDESDHLGRGGATTFLGLAYWGMGELEDGYRWYAEGMASLEKAGYVTDVVGAGIIGADIRLAQGRLGDAMHIYEDGLARAMRVQPPLRGATDMHTGLASIAYQRGRLEEAKAQLEAGRSLGDELAFPRDPYRSRLVRARILQAEGDLDGAIPLLDEAERLYLSEYSPDIQPVPAVRARILVAHGRLDRRPHVGASGRHRHDGPAVVRSRVRARDPGPPPDRRGDYRCRGQRGAGHRAAGAPAGGRRGRPSSRRPPRDPHRARARPGCGGRPCGRGRRTRRRDRARGAGWLRPRLPRRRTRDDTAPAGRSQTARRPGVHPRPRARRGRPARRPGADPGSPCRAAERARARGPPPPAQRARWSRPSPASSSCR